MAEAIGIGESASADGAVTAPVLGAAVCSIPAPGAGVYDVSVVTFEQGTVDAKQANMELRHGAVVEGPVLSTSLMTPQEFGHVTVAAGEAITVNATTAGGAGSIYVASIVATRVA